MALSDTFQQHAQNPNAPVDAQGRTVLHLAALEGDLKVARLALGAGASIDAVDENGVTPLMLSIITERHALRTFLLEAGAQIATPSGDSALHLAARLGCVESIADIVAHGHGLLLQQPAGAREHTPLIQAVVAGQHDAVSCLLSLGAFVNIADAQNRLPLAIAAESGNVRMAQLLVMQGHADVNAASNPLTPLRPLHIAINAGNTDMARALIALGADPLLWEKGCPMPIVNAAWKGNLNLARHLLEEIPQPPEDSPAFKLALSRAIYEALAYNHQDVALYLIRSGRADLDHPAYSSTPLVMTAVFFDNTDALKALLDAGATPNAQDAQKMTAIDIARTMGRPSACALLEEAQNRLHQKTAAPKNPTHNRKPCP